MASWHELRESQIAIKFVTVGQQKVKQRETVVVGRPTLSQMTSKFGDSRPWRRAAGGLVLE